MYIHFVKSWILKCIQFKPVSYFYVYLFWGPVSTEKKKVEKIPKGCNIIKMDNEERRNEKGKKDDINQSIDRSINQSTNPSINEFIRNIMFVTLS